MSKYFWEILDVPMKYQDNNCIVDIRYLDTKNRIVLPPQAKPFYTDRVKIILNTEDGTMLITPLKK